MMSSNSQNGQLLDYLKRRGSITPLEAFTCLGIMRLAARIFDLRNKGYGIEQELIDVPAARARCKVARYTLVRGTL